MIPKLAAALALTVLAVAAAGCSNGRDDKPAEALADRGVPGGVAAPAGGEPASTRPQEFTGTLEGGVVSIGGETTGWRVVADGQAGAMDVDVSKVRADADRLSGKRVKVSGRMSKRNWPERGETDVLVAERIEPATTPTR